MKKASLVLISTVVLSLSLASGARAARRPAWVNGQDPRYPDSAYITGVGVSDDLDGARSGARAEISKVFQSRVQQVTSETQTETSAKTARQRARTDQTQDVRTKTQVSTESLLEGVQVTDTWFDPKKKKHYALAVLNKTKTRGALASQITEKEEAIQSRLSQAKSAATPLDRARAYALAERAGEERDALVARRRLVDPVGVPEIDSSGSTAALQKNLTESLSKISFAVDADGGEGSRLKEAVAEKITGLGFKVTDSTQAVSTADNPVLKVKCRLTLEPFDRGNPSWKFFQWHGTVEIADGIANGAAGGKVLASSTPSGSEGHLTEATAKTKARNAGEEAVAQEVQEKISQYVLGGK